MIRYLLFSTLPIRQRAALPFLALAVGFLLSTSCREQASKKTELPAQVQPDRAGQRTEGMDSVAVPARIPDPVVPLDKLPDTAFVRLADYSPGFAYELRYATENNFLKEAVYPCAACYTRVRTAKALLQVNQAFHEKGYRIRFYDCYRPNSVQYKMWDLVSNPQYVANPDKGSIHNRGGAVDITLETLQGDPLDMGTDFDFFGPRAHHDHTDLPNKVLENRRLLRETMESFGFHSIRTEWWHYNLGAASRYPVADFKWPCPDSQAWPGIRAGSGD